MNRRVPPRASAAADGKAASAAAGYQCSVRDYQASPPGRAYLHGIADGSQLAVTLLELIILALVLVLNLTPGANPTSNPPAPPP
jgi:hypothetical protein